MLTHPFDLQALTRILENTPKALSTTLAGLPDNLIRQTEGPGTWSPYDIVGHLIHGEKTDWIPRAKQILGQTDTRFEPFDREGMFATNTSRSLKDLLEEFKSLRSENLKTLSGWNLTESTLLLEGVHPEFGRVTLRQLLATWPTHDLSHLTQIQRILARYFTHEVGPWKAYIGILSD